MITAAVIFRSRRRSAVTVQTLAACLYPGTSDTPSTGVGTPKPNKALARADPLSARPLALCPSRLRTLPLPRPSVVLVQYGSNPLEHDLRKDTPLLIPRLSLSYWYGGVHLFSSCVPHVHRSSIFLPHAPLLLLPAAVAPHATCNGRE